METHDKKYTLNRELEANREINNTMADRKVTLVAVILFLTIILSVPLMQSIVGIPTARLEDGDKTEYQGMVEFVCTVNARLIDLKNDWEKQMEESFFLYSDLVAAYQYIMTTLFRIGNDKAIVGKDGWLFYTNDIAYLTAKTNCEKREQYRLAVECIADFSAQLAARGIELIVMPVPLKTMIYPEKLSGEYDDQTYLQNSEYNRWISELEKRQIRVVDPTMKLCVMKRSGIPTYLKTDTHWTPQAMEAVAGEVCRQIEEIGVSESDSSLAYTRVEQSVSQQGDIYTMLKLKMPITWLPCEQVVSHAVWKENGHEKWNPEKQAEILLLGDSFSNIYSLAEMGWGTSAGLAEQISYCMNCAVDVIRRNDKGSIATRQILQSDLLRGNDRLAGKRVVVWEFAMRELMQGDWRKLDMAIGDVKDVDGFLELFPDEKMSVKGRIVAMSAISDPEEVTYADQVMAVHLTDLTDEHGKPIGKDALVYVMVMRNRMLLASSRWKVGDRIALELESWLLHEDKEGTFNRNELDDPDMWLAPPLWGDETMNADVE